jgi:hypothetical protein
MSHVRERFAIRSTSIGLRSGRLAAPHREGRRGSRSQKANKSLRPSAYIATLLTWINCHNRAGWTSYTGSGA